jgi:hypothetical protein
LLELKWKIQQASESPPIYAASLANKLICGYSSFSIFYSIKYNIKMP